MPIDIGEQVKKRTVQRTLLFSICVLLLVTFGVVWQVNINEPHTISYDEGVFLLSARLVLEGHHLFTEIFSAQPPVFLETMALAFRLFGDTVVVGREMTILFSLIGLAAAAFIVWRTSGPLAAPIVIFCLGIHFLFFRLARNSHADTPALALALLAIAFVLPSRSRKYGVSLVLGGVCFGLSLLTKLLTIFMIIPLLFLLVLLPSENEPGKWHFLSLKREFGPFLSRRLFPFALGAGLSFCILFRYDLSSAYDQLITFRLAAKNAFGSNYLGNSSILGTWLMQNFGLTCLAVTGFIALLKKNPLVTLWLALWTVAVTSFIIGYSPLFRYHLVILLPPLAFLAGSNVYWFPFRWQKIPWKPLVLILLLLSYAGPSIFHDLRLLKEPVSESEKKVLHLIQHYTQPGDIVISDDQFYVFLTRRTVPPNLCDTSRVRIKSGYLTDGQVIAASKDARMVLFWRNRLGHLPEYRKWVRLHFRFLDVVGDLDDDNDLEEVYLSR